MNDLSVVAALEMQRVGPVDQLKDGLQFVIPIRPLSDDVQEQVQLGRGRAVTQNFVHGGAKTEDCEGEGASGAGLFVDYESHGERRAVEIA
ncbi:hypothetical protein [Pandoraea anapnoica]|uniref:hypothetical protein n=1 Tax=Pandoraea anapnoica TaxID=2508301 RepID=UPI001FE81E4C|nr:hypothetical protein [Pandoraea anapnoica]